jgi:hypothetical protein
MFKKKNQKCYLLKRFNNKRKLKSMKYKINLKIKVLMINFRIMISNLKKILKNTNLKKFLMLKVACFKKISIYILRIQVII